MIVNVRGPSGSGKSTIVRDVLRRYPTAREVFEPGRRRPISYVIERQGLRDVVVLGHYVHGHGGGCDTINMRGYRDKVRDLVREAHDAGRDALFEGLHVSTEVLRTVELVKTGLPLLVLFINLPVEECLASINERRRTSAGERALVEWHGRMRRTYERLTEGGVACRRGSREEVARWVREELRL